MIHYEYEDDNSLNDFKMPISRNENSQGHSSDSQRHHMPDPNHWMSSLEADLFTHEDVQSQVDEYCQLIDSENPFSLFDGSTSEPFGESMLDSQTSSYYGNSTNEDPALIEASQYHELERVSPPVVSYHHHYHQQPQHVVQHLQPPLTPLRKRDLNVPTYTPPKKIVVPKEKSIRPATQRRPIDEFPTKNGFKKPLFSYSCLIGLAMRNSGTGQMTVAEIYRFLCANFPFFQEAPSGWKNSVRHNLSLNKCFQKVDTQVPDPQGRRSCLWCINPSKADKMTSEINKWRERCESTIELAMDNPAELDDIIHGRKGMPPMEETVSSIDQMDWSANNAMRPRDRIVIVKPDKSRQVKQFDSHNMPSNSNVVVRAVRYEPYDEYAVDENYVPEQPSPNGSRSIHAQATMKFGALLERKKLATVHPRNEDVHSP